MSRVTGPRVALAQGPGDPPVAGELDLAIRELAAATMLRESVGPIVTELVRLRCAQVHDCRLCGSLRLDSALERGLDEEVVPRIARYEEAGFDQAAVAALRLADAIILAPHAADAGLRADLRAHFSDAEIAELCLDVMKWSYQKVLVSLRLETPPGGGLGKLSFDGDGEPLIDGLAASGSDSSGSGLRGLEDEREIERLLYLYARALDGKDWPALADCFVADAVAEYGELGGTCTGREAIVGVVEDALTFLDSSQHLIGNPVVDLGPGRDEASSSCYLQAQHVKLGVAGGDLFTVGGVYTDKLRRTPNGWRIVHRTLTPQWTGGNPGMFAP